MRSVRLAGSSSNLLAQITQLVPAGDEKTRFFIEWWLRMHKRPFSLAAVALKFVEWADDGAAAQRFVWEVCRWPQGPKGRASEWTFVCWMIDGDDGDGMWSKPFSSKRAAMAHFRQPATVVMVRSVPKETERPARDDDTDGEQLRAAS